MLLLFLIQLALMQLSATLLHECLAPDTRSAQLNCKSAWRQTLTRSAGATLLQECLAPDILGATLVGYECLAPDIFGETLLCSEMNRLASELPQN